MLAKIGDQLELTSPGYAEAVIDAVIKRGNALENLPYSGRMLPETKFKPVWEAFVSGYRLVYYVGSTQIEIFAVLSQAQRR